MKTIVSVSEKTLPAPLFRAAFDRGFSSYRMLLRALYSRHVWLSRLRRDERERQRRSTILGVMPFSLVGAGGLEATYDAVRAAEEEGLDGAIAECGVAQGGAAALMALVAARFGDRRDIWLFDSFEGLPEPGQNDFKNGSTGNHIRELPPGSCLGTQPEVEALLFGRFRLSRARIRLVKGWFENTLKPNAPQVGRIAVLRIDADWYESVKCCLETLFDQVVAKGFLIVDDYFSCFGAQKAVDEFLKDRRLQVSLVPDGRGGVFFRKP
ncbi:MAG: class I SAM-dependent methyltransferase [Elusimicrobia bacterium]|nr:class I SAM-dependent methyltransferase [Elusimicrobiota bacterium]